MSLETEQMDTIELKLPASPTTQSDLSADGDASTIQSISVSNDKVSSSLDTMNCEPKVKKRRKQSNPLKIQNPISPKFDLPAFDLADNVEQEENQEVYNMDEELQNQNILEKSKSSSKGSLSRVTNALYNNKLREIAKSSSNVSKSKESSLQSLTDISSPESSEEVMSNSEFIKTSVQNSYSQMPPLLPINPVDIARDAMKLSVYPFSEFSSPLQQGNVNLSVSQRSFVTSNGVRVFNPEAYCELCEKEFCNKYFLKTHKANKHGICSTDSSSGGYSYKTPFKSVPANNQPTQQLISQMCENGATFGSADSYCNICQKYFCNKYFLKKHRQNIHGIHEESPIIPSSIHVPVISSPLPLLRSLNHDSKLADNSSVQSTKDEDSKAYLENLKNSLNNNVPILNGSSLQTPQSKSHAQSINQKEKKSEKFLCDLCNIEFCDKCYLDAHRVNKHGQTKVPALEFPDFSEIGKIENTDKTQADDNVEDAKDFKGQMCAPCMKNFTSVETFQYHMLEVHGASLKEEDDSSRTSDTVFKKCSPSSFEEKSTASLDKSPSSIEFENSNSFVDSLSYNCTVCALKCRDKKSFLAHLESDHNIQGSTALDMCLMQEGTTCDVCQEQFLDRVSVISHKLKVHGIISSGLETYPEAIEAGDFSFHSGGRKSGGSSFCQICNKELCNKYFMKTHMMKMHGIDVDKVQQDRWPTTAGGGVFCDICQKFLCSKYFLKVHKQNVHGIMDDSMKVSMVGSPSYNNLAVGEKKNEWHSINSQSAKLNDVSANDDVQKRNNNVFSCDLCNQEFLDKVALQVHLVNKHVKPNESKSYLNSIAAMYSLSEEDSMDALRSGILPCSCCSYVNMDDSSKLSHLASRDLKMISCVICNVTYRQLDYHTHHLSHGVSLPTGKKLPLLENGIHNHSGSLLDEEKLQPRKFKRFRCSKCDKTFRTKLKCLHHIQIMHKSKKGLTSQCEQPALPRKTSLHNNVRKNSDLRCNGPENGTGLIGGKEIEGQHPLVATGFPDPSRHPAPYKLPENSKVIMQPFHLSEPKPDGVSKQNTFVPALVYLPVSQEVSETVTVAFTLTPA